MVEVEIGISSPLPRASGLGGETVESNGQSQLKESIVRSVTARTWWAGLLIVISCSPLIAQETRSSGLDSASVLLLKPDRFVRLELPDLGRIQGIVGFRTATELVLKMESESRTVSLGAVDTLWVRGRRTTTGAIIGAILGAGGGAMLGALADGLCEFDCGGDSVLPGALLGAAAGGLAGALVGAAIPRWKRVFPR
jgi:hypothetical protein